MLADAPRYEKVKKGKGKSGNSKGKPKSVAGFFQSRLQNTDES